MVNIVDLVEKINKFEFDIYQYTNRNIDLPVLEDYKDKKILLVGFSNKYIYKFDYISSFNLDKIDKIIKNYDLLFVGEKFSYLSNKELQEFINYIEKNKISAIFDGYSCYLNVNIDNHKNMFRPLDITKYPYEIKKYKTIKKNFSLNHTIKYILLLLFVILLNYRYRVFLNKINLLVVLILVIILPYRKTIYIDNS